MTEIRIDPASTALLLMDVHPPEHDQGTDSLAWRRSLTVIEALLAAARQRGLLVVHAREASGTDCPEAVNRPVTQGPTSGTTHDGSVHRGLPPPILGEPVVDAADCPSLQQTQLERILVSGGIRALLLAGHTNVVHVSNVLGAVLEGGYRCLLVGDACHCPHSRHGNSALHMLMDADDAGTTVVGCDEVLAALHSTRKAMM